MNDQIELKTRSALLDVHGELLQVGWARSPLLDCNLENVRTTRLPLWQTLRVKRWDYYGIMSSFGNQIGTPFGNQIGPPTHFFSITLADLGYAGQVFAYLIDFAAGTVIERTLTLPLALAVSLPRNSSEGSATFGNGRVSVDFICEPGRRRLAVTWPNFGGRDLAADITLETPAEHESLVVIVPMPGKRFYYNRKMNCLPAAGEINYGGQIMTLQPHDSLGTFDWGRGVWPYRSHWVWASLSAFLPDGRAVGLNLGAGFGDTSAATENALILEGRIHKLGRVDITFDREAFMRPWHMRAEDGRLEVTFTPVLERVARTDMLLVASEVHQMFGRYTGRVRSNEGETIQLDGPTGFAEAHWARW